jgi:outer membrane beta-barrel protein
MNRLSTAMLIAFSLSCANLWAEEQANADKKQAPVKKEAPVSLEDQLKALDAANQAPAAANREKLYAVQQRYLPLKWKSEFSAGYGYNMTGDSFLRTQQAELAYHLHFNDRFSIALAHAFVNNAFKSETDNIRTTDGAVIPDVPYAYTRSDLLAEVNMFYGKFRWGPDTVSYFDAYLALGPGLIRQNNGKVGAGVGDVGFAFWLGKWGSARLGLKDYVYNETYRSEKKLQQNIHAHFDVGYLF